MKICLSVNNFILWFLIQCFVYSNHVIAVEVKNDIQTARSLIQSLSHNDKSIRENAENTLFRLGERKQVQQVLRENIKHKNYLVREGVSRVILRIDLKEFKESIPFFKHNLTDTSYLNRIYTLSILYRLREITREGVITELLEIFTTQQKPDIRIAALKATREHLNIKVHLPLHNYMINAYSDVNPTIRFHAIEILEKVKDNYPGSSTEIFYTFLRAAKDSSSLVKTAALFALGRYQMREYPQVINVFNVSFYDPDIQVRSAAIISYALAGGRNYPDIIKLEEAFQNRSEINRFHFLRLIGYLQLEKKEMTRLVEIALNDSSPLVNSESLRIYAELKFRDKTALKKVLSYINSDDYQVRRAAMSSLDNFEKNPEDFLPIIDKLINSSKTADQLLAVELVGKTGIGNVDIANEIVSFLGNKNFFQIQVVNAIETLSRKFDLSHAIPGLIKLLEYKRYNHQALPTRIGYVLKSIHKTMSNKEQHIIETASNILKFRRDNRITDDDVFDVLFIMMTKINKRTIPILCAYYTFNTQQQNRTLSVIPRIIKLRSRLNDIEILSEMLMNKNHTIRACAAETLSAYGYKSKHILPVLKNLSKDDNTDVRRVVIRAIRIIESSQEPRLKPDLRTQSVNKNKINKGENSYTPRFPDQLELAPRGTFQH